MFSLQFIDIIILIAASQGFLLSVLLFHKHGDLFATRFLGLLILLYSIILGHLVFGELTRSPAYYLASPLIIGIAFTMIPLHYLYTKYLVTNAATMEFQDLFHFLPFLIWEVFWIVSILIFRDNGHLWEFAIGSRTEHQTFILFHWLIIIQAVIYFYGTLKILSGYAVDIREVFSSVDRIKLDWLRYMTYLALALVFGFFLENSLRMAGIDLSYQFNFSSLLVAIYVYTIGYLALFKSEIFSLPAVADSFRYLSQFSQKPDEDTRGPKYVKSGLRPEQIEQFKRRLLRLMEQEQPYRESDLALNQVADMLSISPHNLSEVINTGLGKNFFDFINEYRVDRVKQDLRDSSKENLTILSVAYDAGFNSKSAFYSIFKKMTGMTPSEYRQQSENNKE